MISVKLLLIFPLALELTIADKKYQFWSLFPKNSVHLQLLKHLETEANDNGIDFWSHPLNTNRSVELLLPPDYIYKLKNIFDTVGMKYEIISPDVNSVLNKTAISKSKRSKRAAGGFYDFRRYQDYSTMIEYMYDISLEYPDFIKMVNLGKTHEDRTIWGLEMGKPRSDGKNKPIIWIDGGAHAREWPAIHTVFYFIDQIVKKYEIDATITDYINELDFIIVPVLNPDGFVFTLKNTDPKYRLWRKNRRSNRCSPTERECCYGVDLNRNFDHHFNNTNVKPCHPNYPGPKAFSEPETAAVRDYIMPRSHRMKAFVSIHTFGQLLLYPYGHSKNAVPENALALRRVAEKSVAAIKRVYGTKFNQGGIADVLYIAPGTSLDWAKSKARIRYTYLFELRPDRYYRTDTDAGSGGFLLGESDLLPVAKETWEGVKVIINAVLDEDRERQRLNANRFSQERRSKELERVNGDRRSFAEKTRQTLQRQEEDRFGDRLNQNPVRIAALKLRPHNPIAAVSERTSRLRSQLEQQRQTARRSYRNHERYSSYEQSVEDPYDQQDSRYFESRIQDRYLENREDYRHSSWEEIRPQTTRGRYDYLDEYDRRNSYEQQYTYEDRDYEYEDVRERYPSRREYSREYPREEYRADSRDYHSREYIPRTTEDRFNDNRRRYNSRTNRRREISVERHPIRSAGVYENERGRQNYRRVNGEKRRRIDSYNEYEYID